MNSHIQQLIDEVNPFESKRFNCPVCNGSNSFSVTNKGAVIDFNCFKAGCTLRGKQNLKMSTDEIRKRLDKILAAPKPFEIPKHWTRGSNERCIKFLAKYNCLEPYRRGLFSIAYDPKEDRLVFLSTNAQGVVIGATGRSLKYQKVKTRNYDGSASVPFIIGNSKRLMIVEDCLSAVAVTNIKNMSGMALLGTNVKDEYIEHLQRFEVIYIALDKDARNKALDINQNLVYYHNNTHVVLLDKDIKNMTLEEINELELDV